VTSTTTPRRIALIAHDNNKQDMQAGWLAERS